MLDCMNNQITMVLPVKILRNLDYFNYLENPFEKIMDDTIKKSIENPIDDII